MISETTATAEKSMGINESNGAAAELEDRVSGTEGCKQKDCAA